MKPGSPSPQTPSLPGQGAAISDRTRGAAPKRHHEDALQVAVKQFLDSAMPINSFWYAVPNGGARGKTEAARMKGMGVKAGVPDIALVYQGHAFFIELKSATGSLSKAQKDRIPEIGAAGAGVAVCYTISDVEHALRGWSFPLRATVMA